MSPQKTPKEIHLRPTPNKLKAKPAPDPAVGQETWWEKVDWKKVCKRTFDTCVEDVMIATGEVAKQQIETVKKMGKLKEAAKQGYDKCMKKCKDQNGTPSNGDKIYKCMKKKTCKEYAECIKSEINK